jgi:hypothetical protein
MDEQKFPFEEDILNMTIGEETIVYLKGRPFVISPATEADIERIGHGYFCMD